MLAGPERVNEKIRLFKIKFIIVESTLIYLGEVTQTASTAQIWVPSILKILLDVGNTSRKSKHLTILDAVERNA